jgi:hypothetical protein
MLEQRISTAASSVAKLATLPRTACKDKEKEKEGLETTSSTLTQKMTPSMKEAKPKEAEWRWSKVKWMPCHSTKGKSSSKN